MLPDAKGYISMQRYLNGNTDEIRQRMRDEMFSTTPADLKAFGAVLQGMKDQAVVKVLGSESAIKEANRANNNFLNVFKVL
jgi:hypothetical protein